MSFSAELPSGAALVLDASPEAGGEGRGPSPVEALLAAAAACSGMDVVSILRKKQQEVSRYEVEVVEERGPEGVYPRPILRLRVEHRVWGPGLDPAAVARAVELSDSKYCTVLATLRNDVEVESVWSANPS
jgi:putative redox protein